MGGYIEFSVYLSCLSLAINFYFSFLVVFGVLSHLLLFLLISCALFGILLRFRIPKPVDSTICSIFGNEWGAYKVLPNDSDTDDNYVMKIVAHRACGFDAPENSLSAIKKVG